MSQFDDLNTNIENITKTIFDIKENLSAKKPCLNIDVLFLTERQIAKKITVLTLSGTPVPGAVQSGDQISSVKVNENASEEDLIKQAHMIHYGKFLYDENPGSTNLYPYTKIVDDDKLYPDCVDPIKLKYEKKVKIPKPDLKQWIKEKKKEFSNSFKQLHYKYDDLQAAANQCIKEIGLSTATIASAAVMVPPGLGTPIAIQAMSSIVSSVMNLQSKITDIVPLLGVFSLVGVLLLDSAVDIVVGAINIVLGLINGVLSIIEGLTGNPLFIIAKNLV